MKVLLSPCPACMPEMLAVSADGNRKLYRFHHKVFFCFSLFIDLFIYFIYLMDVFPIFLSSSALMILPFLRALCG